MSNKLFLTKVGGGLDPDVIAFLSATGISDTTITNALNTFVLDLKANSLWARIKFLHVYVGGTAFTHKFNLKSPLDLDTSFRLAFSGGWTHSSNGSLPNGSSGFARTFLVPSTELTTTSGHLFFYSRTNSNTGSPYDMGCSDDNGVVLNTTAIITRYNSNLFYGLYGNGSYSGSVSSTDSRGGFMVNRNDGTNTTMWKNGVKVKTTTESVTLPSNGVYIGCINANGSANFFSNKEIALTSSGGGFSDAEALIYYNSIQNFQTALGRQV